MYELITHLKIETIILVNFLNYLSLKNILLKICLELVFVNSLSKILLYTDFFAISLFLYSNEGFLSKSL